MRIFGSQLTPEQLEERRKGIGASDAAKIIAGGEAWVELWKDKTGRETPKRIMREWDAALRHVTEGLQCDWYEHKTGRIGSVQLRGQAMIYKDWPVLRCTLDGATFSDTALYTVVTLDTVFECKHVSQWTPDPINWAVEKYTPQIMHQMIVCGTDKAIMSVMVGMNEPELVNFTLDPFLAEAYVNRCREFWRYVEEDIPPPGAEPMQVAVPHEAMKEVDYSSSNEFGSFAVQWLENKDAAKKFKAAENSLKEIIPNDVKRAYGKGIEIKRAKSGALTIKESK